MTLFQSEGALCMREIRIDKFSQLTEVAKEYDEVVIYGAGLVVRNMLRVFESVSYELLDRLNCLVVTKKNADDAGYEKLSLPVYEIHDKRELLKNKRVLLVIAVKGDCKTDMLQTACDYTENIAILDDSLCNLVLNKTPLKNLKFEIQITGHCNLNCKGCGAFSNVRDEWYISIEEFERDMKRIGELFMGKVEQIHIFGGEPLLHPQINTLLKIARKYITDGKLQIVTNGILLPKMGEEFWETCRDNRIEINPTKYPISLDWELVEELAKKHNVEYGIFDNCVRDSFYKVSYNLEGNLDKVDEFFLCFHANGCIRLKDGKLSTCGLPQNIKYLREIYGVDIPDFSNDEIDIYKDYTKEEILEFLVKPIDLCAYCNTNNWTLTEWKTGKAELEDWI